MLVLKHLLKLIVVFATTSALSGCGGGERNAMPAPTQPPPATGQSIVIADFVFEPADLSVKVGETITVTNQDDDVHTLTAEDKSFDTGPLSKGQSATITVTKRGPNPYFCGPHPFMRGVIQAT